MILQVVVDPDGEIFTPNMEENWKNCIFTKLGRGGKQKKGKSFLQIFEFPLPNWCIDPPLALGVYCIVFIPSIIHQLKVL